ncbi:hypothetical protein DV515_00015196, partial [Chloebia gouldiae]
MRAPRQFELHLQAQIPVSRIPGLPPQGGLFGADPGAGAEGALQGLLGRGLARPENSPVAAILCTAGCHGDAGPAAIGPALVTWRALQPPGTTIPSMHRARSPGTPAPGITGSGTGPGVGPVFLLRGFTRTHQPGLGLLPIPSPASSVPVFSPGPR